MANYSEAPREIIRIAEELIGKYHQHLKNCIIGFVMRDEAGNSGGKAVLAKTTKVPEKIKPHLSDELDIIIEVAEDAWIKLDSNQRSALVDHELCHISLSDSGWKLRAHDVEEFREIIDRYGLWNIDLMRLSPSIERAAQQLRLPEPEGEVEVSSGGRRVAVSLKAFNQAVELAERGQLGTE